MEEQHQFSPSDFIPGDIVDAVSKIQNYYLIESRGAEMAKEFFDLIHIRAYSRVGFKSALHDSVLWAIGYILIGGVVYFIQENYLTTVDTQVLRWTVHVSPLVWFTKLASFGYLAVSTGCCIYMSQYYIGVVCKRAFNTLFGSRAMFLLTFSICTFAVLGLLYKQVFSEPNLIEFCGAVYKISPDFAARLYHFLMNYFRPSLFESGIMSIVASVISIALPLVTVVFFKYVRRRKEVVED